MLSYYSENVYYDKNDEVVVLSYKVLVCSITLLN